MPFKSRFGPWTQSQNMPFAGLCGRIYRDGAGGPMLAMWGQTAVAQPQPQAVQFSEHTAAAQPAPIPPVYQAASQPQLAPIFQQAAAAAAASTAAGAAAPEIVPFGGKKLRDHAAGKGSNVGTDRGGAGVAKTCRACLLFESKTVHKTAAHNRDCPYCAKCAGKKKKALKIYNGVEHICPYKQT